MQRVIEFNKVNKFNLIQPNFFYIKLSDE